MAKHIHSIKLLPIDFDMIMAALDRAIDGCETTLTAEQLRSLRTELEQLCDYRNYQIMAWMNDDRPF